MVWAVLTTWLFRRTSEPTVGTTAGLPNQLLAVFQVLLAVELVQILAVTALSSTFWISCVEVSDPVPAVKPRIRLFGRV